MKNWWDTNLPNKLEAFREWIGSEEAPTKTIAAKIIADKGIKTLVELGCAEQLFKKTLAKYAVDCSYTGMDASDIFVKNGVIKADIEAIPAKANSFECVYTRHVLEHLTGFKTALSECLRVASKCVMITFFHIPEDDETIRIIDGVNSNIYSIKDIEQLLRSKNKVDSWRWQEYADTNETILIVDIKQV